jgi:hypothetical protein
MYEQNYEHTRSSEPVSSGDTSSTHTRTQAHTHARKMHGQHYDPFLKRRRCTSEGSGDAAHTHKMYIVVREPTLGGMLPESWLPERSLQRRTKGRQRTRRRDEKQRGAPTQAAHHATTILQVREGARARQRTRTSFASRLGSPRRTGCFPRAGC